MDSVILECAASAPLAYLFLNMTVYILHTWPESAEYFGIKIETASLGNPIATLNGDSMESVIRIK